VVLKLAHLQSLVGDELPTVRHYLGLFTASAGSLLEELGQAITARDGTSAKGLAHKLKGLCGTIGAQQMTGLCIRMEEALLGQAWPDADQLQTELRTAFARARAEAEGV
jgi:HPt (histidine-containing phosphotransfer) domain-containing protein